MKIYIKGISTLVIGLFMMGATCSPLSPPAFAPSKSLMNFSDESFNYRLYYGETSSPPFSDRGSGSGTGFESKNRIKNFGFGSTFFKGNGRDCCANNLSLTEFGGFFTWYIMDLDRVFMIAVEPRYDMSFITNDAFVVIPNFMNHNAIVLYPVELRLTLRIGESKIVRRGNPVNIEEKTVIDLFNDNNNSNEVEYEQSYLVSSKFSGADIGVLLHFKSVYIGTALGVAHRYSDIECEHCKGDWIYVMFIFGHSIY